MGPSSSGGGGGELEVVGFCCGTLSASDRLTEESMGRHEPDGSLLAIHSVCVAAAMRRRRVATRLLRAYLQFVLGTTPQLEEVRSGEGEGERLLRGMLPCLVHPTNRVSPGARMWLRRCD